MQWSLQCNVTNNFHRRRVHVLPCPDPIPTQQPISSRETGCEFNPFCEFNYPPNRDPLTYPTSATLKAMQVELREMQRARHDGYNSRRGFNKGKSLPAPAGAVRITVTATNGAEEARIVEVRLYDAEGAVEPFPDRKLLASSHHQRISSRKNMG